ncbi:MAG: hypothetical protein AB7E61_06420 [Acholeplasmataceae bacterium]
MAKTNQVEFNVQNVKFAVKSAGVYGAPQDLAYAESISLESTYQSEHKYGDGRIIAELTSDKGLTGSLAIIQEAIEYEIAMGRKEQLADGLIADVTQIDSIEHAIYFEVHQLKDGVRKVKKVWLLNVTSGKPSETWNQSKDSVNINDLEIPLVILGELMMTNDGSEVYVDASGNSKYVPKISATPDYAGYVGFEDAVPVPKAAA